MFDANKEGYEYFDRYLSETLKLPIYLPVDVFEEEFKHDTIPHLFGADRVSTIERKKSRLFRDTPYFYSKILGRNKKAVVMTKFC